MRRFLLFLIVASLFPLLAGAQKIAVKNFSLAERDLDANTKGTMVFDQNGEKCALIKVQTTELGLSFEDGSLGIVDVKQHVAEV